MTGVGEDDAQQKSSPCPARKDTERAIKLVESGQSEADTYMVLQCSGPHTNGIGTWPLSFRAWRLAHMISKMFCFTPSMPSLVPGTPPMPLVPRAPGDRMVVGSTVGVRP